MIGAGLIGRVGRRGVLPRLPAVLLAAGFALGARLSPAAAAEPLAAEYQLKAAFVKNIVKFVTWPPGTTASLTLCLLVEDPFNGAFAGPNDLGDGRSLAGRRIDKPQEAGACQLVFVPSGRRGEIPELLAALGAKPVLTIGDGEGMASEGLMFNFLVVAQKVRFEANLAPARRAGMTVSSRLLGLAKTVHNPR